MVCAEMGSDMGTQGGRAGSWFGAAEAAAERRHQTPEGEVTGTLLYITHLWLQRASGSHPTLGALLAEHLSRFTSEELRLRHEAITLGQVSFVGFRGTAFLSCPSLLLLRKNFFFLFPLKHRCLWAPPLLLRYMPSLDDLTHSWFRPSHTDTCQPYSADPRSSHEHLIICTDTPA